MNSADPIQGVEVPPRQAAGIFGDRFELASRYADLLANEATVRGLIGPAELPRLWSRHLLNCAVLGELVPADADLIDVGSGAGLPGIPLAIARPDLRITLVEPLLRRSSWLEDVVDRLGLDQVAVRRARAEDLAGTLSAAVVTARAVAPLDRLVAWCLPLVKPGGELLAMKGQAGQAELDAATPRLRRMGAQVWEILPIGVDTLADQTSVVRVRVGSSELPTGRSRAGKVGPKQRSQTQGRGGAR
ncbi:MAG: 16S rRNA (guanine(527)-N(7))-methyltransferase RsmG [Actinomycetota bacterium]|nr:16S rRNA (guanine(527)-N(7))-methyltransferase RsmG [Actinomycetota bacterium]